MRLLNTKTLKFEEWFYSDLPVYAVLSHTWGSDEISLQEMLQPTRWTQRKNGAIKIKAACDLALRDSYDYIWIDTICIDKSSSAELSEAINSMFAWYAKSHKCYAYLSDINARTMQESQISFTESRWFTRGWTLQELLAPSRVEFYDMNWIHLGSRLDKLREISKRTGISDRVLSRNQSLRDCPVAMKMSWAAQRQTTRVEDLAYCLLGIFDINMPMLYGEGAKAFRRLQEEIVKKENDMTIFAWNDPMPSWSNNQSPTPLFAPSSNGFATQGAVLPFSHHFYSFTITNKGLFIPGEILLRIMNVQERLSPDRVIMTMYVLFLGYDNELARETRYGVCLRKVGPGLFYRDGRFGLSIFPKTENSQEYYVNDCYILYDPPRTIRSLGAQYRERCIHVPVDSIWKLQAVCPEDRWDYTDSVFIKTSSNSAASTSIVLSMRFSNSLQPWLPEIVVLCDYVEDVPCAKVFRKDKHSKEARFLFHHKHKSSSISWDDFESQFRDSLAWKSRTITNVAEIVTVDLVKGTLNHEVQSIEVFNLKINTTCRT